MNQVTLSLLQDDDSKYSLYRVDTMQGAICGVTVRGPLNAITIRSCHEREYTEEQRQAASARMAALHKQK